MAFNVDTVVDLLDELDLDIRGFGDAPADSLLFTHNFYEHPEPEPSTSFSSVGVVRDLPPVDGLPDEPELGPRKWVAARSFVWNDFPEPTMPRAINVASRPRRDLTIDIQPRSLSRTASWRPRALDSPSPTGRSLSRLRARGSSLAIRALNLAWASPDTRPRVF